MKRKDEWEKKQRGVSDLPLIPAGRVYGSVWPSPLTHSVAFCSFSDLRRISLAFLAYSNSPEQSLLRVVCLHLTADFIGNHPSPLPLYTPACAIADLTSTGGQSTRSVCKYHTSAVLTHSVVRLHTAGSFSWRSIRPGTAEPNLLSEPLNSGLGGLTTEETWCIQTLNYLSDGDPPQGTFPGFYFLLISIPSPIHLIQWAQRLIRDIKEVD